MSSANNVIPLRPGTRNETVAPSLPTMEDLNRIQVDKTDLIDKATEMVATEAIAMLVNIGFDLNTLEANKDAGMIVQSIKSLVCRQYGIEHSFQQFSDNFFQPGDSPGSLTFTAPVLSMKKTAQCSDDDDSTDSPVH